MWIVMSAGDFLSSLWGAVEQPQVWIVICAGDMLLSLSGAWQPQV
jgi:hypothetical protein